MKNESAVVLLSGGQDSTTCLFWALQKFHKVLALSVYYGQRHARELEAAHKIAQMAGVEHMVVNIPQFGMVSMSALTQPTGERPPIEATGGYADRGAPAGLPNTFVPGRNALFLTIAASLAVSRKMQVVVTGVCETDYSGYPDCRSEFVQSMENALRHAMPSESALRIATPLMYLNKSGIVRMAQELGPSCWEALSHSLTCYEGHDPACHHCPACILRDKGFADAGVSDPAVVRWLQADADKKSRAAAGVE